MSCGSTPRERIARISKPLEACPMHASMAVAERMAIAVHMRTFELAHRFEAEWKPRA